MRKLIYLTICMFLTASFSLFAQHIGEVRANVLDQDQQPFSAVTVRLSNQSKGVLTNSKGEFSFRHIPFGTYTIEVSAVGYFSVKQEVHVDKALVILDDIVLIQNVSALEEIRVNGAKNRRVEEVNQEETEILLGGKKSESIKVSEIDADISQKNARQIFAKVPGIYVYDMDGSGNQVNIASRGLDPHRSWEFNVRLDNVVTNSDMYGYPASHFSMPMESIEKVDIVRGTGSLQYGAQFGGMLNFVSKKADSTRKAAFESINSVGSYGLKSTYNALGGTIGKLKYYAYFSKRVSKGFRQNAESNYESEYLRVDYDLTKRTKLSGGLARSVYIYRIPGPLSETQFAADPRQSSRNRNYYTPNIFVPFVQMESRLKDNSRFKVLFSAVLGQRSSVQFTGVSGVPDEPDAQNIWPSRQVDIDNYHSFTSEFSYTKTYQLANKKSTFHAGLRLIKNDLHRRQKGKSAETFGPNFTVTSAGFGRDMHYLTDNAAFFIEHKTNLNEKLSVNTGLRYENGLTRLRGRIDDYPENEIPTNIRHYFPLFGVDFNYKLNKQIRVYGGWSQAYRPVIFADIIPANSYEFTDRNLKDAKGHNAELGIQGTFFQSRLSFNITAFEMTYKNRMGKQALEDAEGNTRVLLTNIGNSRTLGLESYLDFLLHSGAKTQWSVFTATSYMQGKYLSGAVRNGTMNEEISGNQLPAVPHLISRNGLSFKAKRSSATLQYSYTSSFYSDPLNTAYIENGTVGLVPSYGVLDLNGSYKLNAFLRLKLSFSNLTNKIYYTKRPTGYPGPGIWTSDGRSIVGSIQFNI